MIVHISQDRMKMGTEDYVSENVTCDSSSSISPEECEQLVGKTIAKVDAGPHEDFTLIFTDGSSVECGVAQSYLSIEFDDGKPTPPRGPSLKDRQQLEQLRSYYSAGIVGAHGGPEMSISRGLRIPPLPPGAGGFWDQMTKEPPK